jgi:hypothetical protein
VAKLKLGDKVKMCNPGDTWMPPGALGTILGINNMGRLTLVEWYYDPSGKIKAGTQFYNDIKLLALDDGKPVPMDVNILFKRNMDVNILFKRNNLKAR